MHIRITFNAVKYIRSTYEAHTKHQKEPINHLRAIKYLRRTLCTKTTSNSFSLFTN